MTTGVGVGEVEIDGVRVDCVEDEGVGIVTVEGGSVRDLYKRLMFSGAVDTRRLAITPLPVPQLLSVVQVVPKTRALSLGSTLPHSPERTPSLKSTFQWLELVRWKNRKKCF